MSRPRLPIPLAVLAVLAMAGTTRAQPVSALPAASSAAPASPPPARSVFLESYLLAFERMKSLSIELRRAAFKQAYGRGAANPPGQLDPGEAPPQRRFSNVAVRSPALDQENALTSMDRASAAIKTSVEGAEAGISVAPLALLGYDEQPHQINLTLAALKDSKTRFGVAYGYEPLWTPLDTVDLGLDPCDFKDVEPRFVETIDQRRTALARVCEQIVAPLVEPMTESETDRDKACAALACGMPVPERARALCGKDPSATLTLKVAIGTIGSLVAEETKRLAANERDKKPQAAAARFAFEERLLGVRDSQKLLDDFKEPKPEECHGEEEIARAIKRVAFTRQKHRFGAGGTVDLFPILLGFQPDPEEQLARGELQRWQARVEYASLSDSFGVTLGMGAGQVRDALADPMFAFLSPSFSLAAVVGSLTTEPLRSPQGQLRLTGGELPPRLSLGLDLSVDIALDRPESQVTALQRFNGTVFLDFLFTEKLAFRLGVPVAAEIQRRKADTAATPPVAEKRDLQWTFPVALTTILKM